MEKVEFWIWEHSMKYGMSKVIERIRVDYGKSVIPNSWITALFLQEITNSWEFSRSKITFNEVNALRQLLSSTFKHYKDSLAGLIETKHFVKLDLTLRAVFLILRSSSNDSALVKKRARDELFPVWNTGNWEKIKERFCFKNDIHHEEIRQFYLQLRSWLACENSHKDILQTFDSSIKEHFPVLIEFMRRIKLSMLERMKARNVAVSAHLEFLLEPLAQATLTDEAAILRFLDILRERKVNSIGVRFLKLKKCLHPGKPENVIGSTLYTIPSAFRSTNNNTPHLYPSCFDRHPCMPSSMWLKAENRYEKLLVNRVHPRDKSGIRFEPFWFATTSLTDPKAEQITYHECEDNREEVLTQRSQSEETSEPSMKEAGLKRRSTNDESQDENSSLSLAPSNGRNKEDNREQGQSDLQTLGDKSIQNIQEMQTSNAECYQTCLTSFSRRRCSLDSIEENKADAEVSLKKQRFNSVDGSEIETSLNCHANLSLPVKLDPEAQLSRLPVGHSQVVTECYQAINDVNSQSPTTAESSDSLCRIVQELSEHTSQLQKLDVESETGILSTLLSRLRGYKRKLF